MKAGDAPAGPDYASLIPLQKQANLDVFNTMLNASRSNQYTPYGSSTWEYTPPPATAVDAARGVQTPAPPPQNTTQFDDGANGSFAASIARNLVPTAGSSGPAAGPSPQGTWTNRQTLSPEQQALYSKNVGSQIQLSDLLSGMAGQVGAATRSPIDFSGAPSLVTGGHQYNQESADAAYRDATRYLQPQQDNARKQLEARLGEQGFVPGTPGYNQAMGEFQRNQDLAFGQARDTATTTGFTQGIQGGQFQNNARQQYIAQLLTQRQTPLNEYSALKGNTQVQNPTLQASFSTPQLQGVDGIAAANQGYQNQLGAYNAQVGSDNALMGTLGTLGGSLVGAPWLGSLLSGMGGGGGAGIISGGSGFRP